MLARVVLFLSPNSEPNVERLRSASTSSGVHLEVVDPRDLPWQRLARAGADLVVAARSAIPSPEADSLRLLLGAPDAPELIVLSDHEDAEERARLLAAGCEAVVSSRLDVSVLRELFRTILDRRRNRADQLTRAAVDAGIPRLSDFVSASPAMQAFMEVVARVADTDASLLMLGETGVGKERLARAVHAESRRSEGPFIAVNCGALPESLLESELFGHTEGAFTGATRTRRGWFELAHGGTLFLDEIGEMQLHLQVKLLRALQERAFQPIGSEKTIRIDVRIIAASNRDLEQEVLAGRFRRDLYYRLGVISLTLPALRDRPEDIPDLAHRYLERFASSMGREVRGFDAGALDALSSYAWPGNVRELINVVERAVLLCSGTRITLASLPQSVARAAGEQAVASLVGSTGLETEQLPPDWIERPWREVRREALEKLERAYLASLLDLTRGRIGETARRAGMEPRSLYSKMKRLGLRKERFRS
jgi:DNA-binding NtrC family response regulator